jgi:hypothetical protein
MTDIFAVDPSELGDLTNEQKSKIAREHLSERKKTDDSPKSQEIFEQKPIKNSVVKTSKIPETNWINIPIENLITEGKYYPEGTVIQIRAATSKEVRHYSTMDERDLLNIDDKLNHILEHCLKIFMPDRKISNFKDIKEVDRVYLILAIRDLTFLNGENNLTMNIECGFCGYKNQVNIDKNVISKFNIDSRLDKFYDEEERCFHIVTKDGDEFNLYLPSLGVTNFVKNYARYKSHNNQFIDESFLKLLMYIVGDHRKLDEKMINNLNIETQRWSLKKISIVQSLIDLIDQSNKPEIECNCGSCGEVNKSEIMFQNGYKSLFIFLDVFDQLV